MYLLTFLVAMAAPLDPVAYANGLAAWPTEILDAVDAVVAAPPTDDVEVALAQVQRLEPLVAGHLKTLEHSPAYGDDVELRDALVNSVKNTHRLFAESLPRAIRQSYDTDPTNEELATAGELWTAIAADLARDRQALNTHLERFAERHGHTFVPSPPKRRTRAIAPFTADGLPPKGVEAPLPVYLMMTAAYTNAYILAVNRLRASANEAYGTLGEQDPVPLLAAIRKARTVKEQVQTKVTALDPDWGGDAALSNVASVRLKGVGTALDHLDAVAVELALAHPDLNAASAHIQKANDALTNSQQQYVDGVASWSARYHLDAFAAWGQAALEATKTP